MDERFLTIPNVPTRVSYIQNESDVRPAVRHLLRYDLLGFDTETYHSVDRTIPAFDPTSGAKMRLAQFATPTGRVFIFDLFKVNKRFLRMLFPSSRLTVGQNIKFDMKFLMWELGIYEFGPIFDTMIAEQILSKGWVAGKQKTRVGLDQIADRRLGVSLPKDEQKSDWWMPELSRQQIAYAARDPLILLPIFQVQRQLLVEQSQVRVAELELDAVPAFGNMELNGMYLNKEAWLRVCDQTAKELNEVKNQLWSMLGSQGTLFEDIATINLNSRPKIQQAFQRVGIELPLDKDNKVSLSSRLLKPIIDRKEVRLYVEYVKLAKALSSFGPEWVDKRNPFDGRIHCNLFQIGAETGRVAANNPNMTQIKKEDLYRNCFEASLGWVFVKADYSQCELRILAELCRDTNLLMAFDNDYDIHQYSAHLIYKCAMEAVTKIQRGIAKNLNYGIVYGIGTMKFALDAGIPIQEAEAIMAYYLKQAYPNMGHWLETQGRAILYKMWTQTMTGRIRRYYGDLNDKEFKAQVQRNAKNFPMQGTNADITKRALSLLYKQVRGRTDMKIVLPVHDEIIMESLPPVADECEFILRSAMMEAEGEYLKRVPCKVDSDIALVWSKEPKPEMLQAARDLIARY